MTLIDGDLRELDRDAVTLMPLMFVECECKKLGPKERAGEVVQYVVVLGWCLVVLFETYWAAAFATCLSLLSVCRS